MDARQQDACTQLAEHARMQDPERRRGLTNKHTHIHRTHAVYSLASVHAGASWLTPSQHAWPSPWLPEQGRGERLGTAGAEQSGWEGAELRVVVVSGGRAG